MTGDVHAPSAMMCQTTGITAAAAEDSVTFAWLAVARATIFALAVLIASASKSEPQKPRRVVSDGAAKATKELEKRATSREGRIL